MAQRVNWTEEKDTLLRENYHSMSAVALAEKLECSREAVLRRARTLKIPKKSEAGTSKIRPYTEEEKQYIRDHVFEDGAPAVAEKLGRTEEAIRVFASKNNISVGDSTWSRKELNYLKKHYTDKTNAEIGLAIGRSEAAVQRKAGELNLKKLEGWTEDEDSFLKENYRSMTYADIGRKLNKSADAVRKHAAVLGYKK